MKFKKAYVEITNVCNLSCDFCKKTKRQPKFLTVSEFEHIAGQVKPLCDYVYFHILGEPLLNEKLEDFLNICEKYDLYANITTNGVLLAEVRDVLLSSKALRKVSFSIHAYEANEILNYKDYIINIISFAKEASGKNIICELRLWNKDKNKNNEGIIELIERAINVIIPENADSVKLYDKVFLEFADKFEWPDVNREEEFEVSFCYGLRDQFGILVDGTVVPCCLDSDGDINLGNVFEKELGEILNSGRARRLYNGFSNKKTEEALCKKCGYASRF